MQTRILPCDGCADGHGLDSGHLLLRHKVSLFHEVSLGVEKPLPGGTPARYEVDVEQDDQGPERRHIAFFVKAALFSLSGFCPAKYFSHNNAVPKFPPLCSIAMKTNEQRATTVAPYVGTEEIVGRGRPKIVTGRGVKKRLQGGGQLHGTGKG